jgi:UDPglucose 6-dehydrogenase
VKITVVGTGYVGLVVGTCFAETGHNVHCVDIDAEKVARLSQGQLPIYEPGLEELVNRNIEEERLKFTTDIESAVKDSLCVYLCVGTPRKENGEADMSHTLAAAEQVARAMNGYRVIVIKSTCPLGTANQLQALIGGITKHPFDVVVNPEFLRQGAAVDDFMRPNHVVIGTDDVRVQEIMKELYAPFVRTGKPILVMDIRSAELLKYATNAMLATRISFMNELANICEAFGGDITHVQDGLAADSRFGTSYLFPGLGYGGSCLPKDVSALAHVARLKGLNCDILDAVGAVNERQKDRFVQRILDYYGGAIGEKRIAVWGASFKPKTDDLREGPSLKLIDALLAHNAEVAVYDPVAGPRVRERYGDAVTIAEKNYDALRDADGLAIVTEWNEFRRPDYARMGELMREKVIFDGRNVYTPDMMKEHGFRYFSIGRQPV